MSYQLLDSGNGKKLEAFGSIILQRPCLAALWKPQNPAIWEQTDLLFTRDNGWKALRGKNIKAPMFFSINEYKFLLNLTEFGHIGFFPEHMGLWEKIPTGKNYRALNLFGYTGAFSIHLAKKDYLVTHVDASNPSVSFAKQNAQNNGVSNIRWIVDDAMKFLQREKRRGKVYEMIIMDPPSFGRGPKGEVFQIEKQFFSLIELAYSILDKSRGCLVVSCHTPGFTTLVLEQIFAQICGKPQITKQLFLGKSPQFQIPVGVAAIWKNP